MTAITEGDHRPTTFLAKSAPNADYSRMMAELFLQRGSAQIIHYGTGSSL